MTRTALIMNGLAAFRFSSMRQSAKALFKPKEQNQQLIYQSIELQSMTTREARNYASKLAQLRGIDSVELYRIDKTEIFT